ncbi:protein kinase [Martiniozyma asiatica (nom. inval.)]|nr:protein kinase [Martiniozyma asiatica]
MIKGGQLQLLPFKSGSTFNRLKLIQLVNELNNTEIPNYKIWLDRLDSRDPQMVFNSARNSYQTVLILLARRINKFNMLPYGAMVNPNLVSIWNSYARSLEMLFNFANNDKDVLEVPHLKGNNKRLVSIFEEIIALHSDNIQELNEGLKEVKPIWGSLINEKVFLDDHLKERILMRLVCMNHILLSSNSKGDAEAGVKGNVVGLIDKEMDVLQVVKNSIQFVNGISKLKYDEQVEFNIETIIDSPDSYLNEKNIDLDHLEKFNRLVFPYVRSHVEYVLNEILKNSCRATVENDIKRPIDVLISLKKDANGSTLCIKISDRALGIHPDIVDSLWKYSYTTVKAKENDGQNLVGDNIIAGMGYGLPLSLIYCKLFGGDIRLKSIYGKGTDVYLIWKGI